MFLNFVNADGSITDGINLDSIMTWGSGMTETGEPYVLLRHALVLPTLVPTKDPQPWATRLTGREREQFLHYIISQRGKGVQNKK